MSLKDSLDTKINKYLTLAGGVSVAAAGLKAQVVYTDVNPDYLLSGNLSTYPLDLDNDTNADFMLTNIDTLLYNSVSTGTAGVYSYNLNIKAGFINQAGSSNSWMIGSNSFPTPISQGANVGASGNFGAYGTSTLGFGAPFAAIVESSYLLNGVQVYNNIYTSYGNLSPDQEGILGLKFKINNNIHYGWARVEYTLDGRLSIKDYAYESTADSAIVAGETGAGLVTIKENENSVQISNFNNHLQVDLLSDLANAQLKITNLSGKEIINKELNSLSESISLDEFATGIYIASVTSDEGMVNKKIYIR
jgi:hypothetical protein